MTGARAFVEDRVFPFMKTVADVSNLFQTYFLVQTVTVCMAMGRFFQYLKFQKKLSIVTDTFRGIADDLIHVGFVLVCVCFTLGAMCSLCYGQIDPEFQTFGPS